MVRASLKTKTTFSKKLFGFMVINIVPIVGLGWFVWAVNQGRLSLDDLPEGLDRNGIHLGVAIAILFVVVTFLLPFCHATTRHFHKSLWDSAQTRSDAGFGRLMVELMAWPFRQVFYRTFWTLRFVMFVLAFALIAIAVVFIIRFFNPQFAEEPLGIDRHVKWVEERIEGLGD